MEHLSASFEPINVRGHRSVGYIRGLHLPWALSEPSNAPCRQSPSTLLTAQMHKASPRAGQAGPARDVLPPLLVQLPQPSNRTRVSHEGYNFSSTVSLPPLSPHTVVAAAVPSALLSIDVVRRALPKARIRVPDPNHLHQHGQRRSQHQSMVSNQTEATLDALARVEARIMIAAWSRTERTQKAVAELCLATTELVAELRDNPPLPGTSPLGTKGVIAAEVARQQGDICSTSKPHGFLPKATREAAAKDYLAKRSSQWSQIYAHGGVPTGTIAAGGLMMMSCSAKGE